MNIIDLLLIAFALSMDTFALSLTNGMTILKLKIRHAIVMAVTFAAVQGLLPAIGFFLGRGLASYIDAFAHWIALALLSIIGGKMIIEGIKCAKEEHCPMRTFAFKLIVIQAIATSIDALMVGVTFATMQVPLFAALAIISAVTAVVSLAGIYIGRFFGSLLKSKSEMLGGAILVLIGIKIFIENM